ncbi:uncharacterized protein [Haliotis asinina]|uniref:uncharacterized protein isoform X1 n=1 Tax=Haliotis asinina TaxID=109174 RepID=UPI003532223C
MAWFWIGLFVACLRVALTDAECHCDTETACAVFPSTPCSQVGDPDRCQEGWFGPNCQTQNIALRRSCNQSSTLGNNLARHGAGVGVDGIVTTDAANKPCAHTAEQSNPTWTVNLNTSVPEKIEHIRLYIHEMLQERRNGMEILVGNQICYNWSSTEHPPAIANVTCRQPLTGTTVSIRIPGQQKFLTLCEVQIFVCSNGWFSEECDKQCRCLNSTDACDKITGHCSSGCFPGYNGYNCQTACPHGTFGSNCASRCGNCLNGDICNKATGACPGGCAAGWVSDDLCKEACPDGFYGINCSSKCGNCVDGVSCNRTNGICPKRCAAGWNTDGTCVLQSAAGTHGSNCTSDCGEECSTWGIPVAAVLGVLLICTVTGGTLYIRRCDVVSFYVRLQKQLESLKTKMREEHYVTLDEKAKTTATESTYEHINNATTYYNAVDHLRDES